MQGKLLFLTAVLIGTYSYATFLIGIFGLLNTFFVGLISIIVSVILCFSLLTHIESIKSLYIQSKNYLFYFSVFFALMLINLLGVLGPELGFDALWYHLVIPKLYIEYESIEFIKGGLLYYSLMPKLVDILYIPALMFSGETAAKFMHFLFGILCTIVTYKISNIFVSKKLAYLAAIIFYSNLVIGWMSITAYIDLGRAFFGSLSIYFFLIYHKTKESRYFYFSAVIAGFEIASKLLGISTLISILFTFFVLFNSVTLNEKTKKALLFIVIATIVVSPWLIFSYVNSKNLIYPFFTGVYPSHLSISNFNPLLLAKNTIDLFLYSPDPVSPIYLIIVPQLFLLRKKIAKDLWVVILILLINILIWNFIPQKNSRFVIPYLPLFSLLVVWVISKSELAIQKILYFCIFIIIVINAVYRGVASLKYLPVVLGTESKEKFLEENLNFGFGDYIDTNGTVTKIVGEERVLIKGIHNLYYINFKFDHESWATGINYKYILSKGALSNKNDYNLVYEDGLTGAFLYEKNK